MTSKRILKKTMKGRYRALDGDEDIPSRYRSSEYSKGFSLDDSKWKPRKQKTNRVKKHKTCKCKRN